MGDQATEARAGAAASGVVGAGTAANGVAGAGAAPGGTELIRVSGLVKDFLFGGHARPGKKRAAMRAVSGLSFHIDKGETYGLVGESGCGKSTCGRILVGLETADAGSVVYDGQELVGLSEKEFRPFRREIQMVFQNTMATTNPRQRVGRSLEDILAVNGVKSASVRKRIVLESLREVGLAEEYYFRYPHELSGGQVQRLGIASALLVGPKLMVCDEPVSALDVSIQAQILNMMKDIQRDLGLSYLFISHDMGVVRFIADRVGVMYLGTLVEEASAEVIFDRPLHPYTKALLRAVPDPYKGDKEFRPLTGEQPVRTRDFCGCPFCSRCPYVEDACRQREPELVEVEPGHKAACCK